MNRNNGGNSTMDVVDDAYCFICGKNNKDGLKVVFDFDIEEKKSYLKLKIPQKLQGWKDIVHGGFVATLLDEASAYAAMGTGHKIVTAEMVTRYKKPVPVETEIELFGQVTEIKRKLIFTKSWITIDGKVAAEAESKMFITGELDVNHYINQKKQNQ